MSADGSIRIDTSINDEKLKKQLVQMQNKLRRQTEAVDAQAAKVRNLSAQWERLSAGGAKAEKLRAELAAAGAEADRLAEKLKTVNAQLWAAKADYQAKLQQAAAGKIPQEDFSAAAKDMYTLEDASASLAEKLYDTDQRAAELKSKLAELTVNPDASAAAQKLASDLELARKKLKRLQEEAAETRAEEERAAAAQTESGVAGRIGRLRAELSKLTAHLKGGLRAGLDKSKAAAAVLASKLRAVGKSAKTMSTAGKVAQKFGRRLKSVVAGALIFNLISKALRVLTDQLGAYLVVNSDFAAALSGIKSNLLTAFQPIYDSVLPALTAMLEKVEQLTARMAQFAASIFGTTATRAQENAKALYEQADATEAAGEAAKKAEKFLASFDTIEKIGKEENKTAPKFDTDFSDAASAIPAGLTEFWKPIQESWDQYGAATIQAAKDALQSIKDLVKSIVDTFLDVWSSGAGLTILGSFQQLLQTIFGIVKDIAAAFKVAWDGSAGESVIQSIAFLLTSVMDLLRSIGESFREAWNDGSGVEIMTTILRIVANINNFVGELANRLREAWEANGNGVAIWNAILDIAQDVLDALEDMSAAAADWAQNLNLEPIVTSFRGLLEAAEPLVDLLCDGFAWAWEHILLPLAKWTIEEAAPAAVDVLSTAFKALLPVLQEAGKLFAALWKIISPVASFLGDALVAAIHAVGSVIDWLCGVIADLLDVLADAANKLADFLTSLFDGFGSTVAADMFGTGKANTHAISYSAQNLTAAYPHLARGAVIPPNNEFLAVLGDQRNGVNIETPAETMLQMFRQALSEADIGGDVNINFKGNTTVAQLVRMLYPQIEVERAHRGLTIGGDTL